MRRRVLRGHCHVRANPILRRRDQHSHHGRVMDRSDLRGDRKVDLRMREAAVSTISEELETLCERSDLPPKPDPRPRGADPQPFLGGKACDGVFGVVGGLEPGRLELAGGTKPLSMAFGPVGIAPPSSTGLTGGEGRTAPPAYCGKEESPSAGETDACRRGGPDGSGAREKAPAGLCCTVAGRP